MIYGERLRQAREIAGLTQKALADRVGVHQSTVAQVEKERSVPSWTLLSALAEETGVLLSFFDRPPLPDFSIGSLVYRARGSLKATERDRAYQFTKLTVEQFKEMAEDLNLPDPVVPEGGEDPATSARLARLTLGIDLEKPVSNIINILERHGFLVVALPFELENLDAFSSWVFIEQERPLLCISAGKAGDRLRFSIAHELGHVILHRGLRGNIPALETEANQFAAEFLLPEFIMREMLSPSFNLSQAARLKPRLGVSIQALVRRGRELGIITDRRYHYLFQLIGRNGWRKREPANLDIPAEKPRSFRKMVELTYGTTQEVEKLAESMGVPFAFAHTILEQYSFALSAPDIRDTEEYLYPEDRLSRN